jgi:hypothetical protein
MHRLHLRRYCSAIGMYKLSGWRLFVTPPLRKIVLQSTQQNISWCSFLAVHIFKHLTILAFPAPSSKHMLLHAFQSASD